MAIDLTQAPPEPLQRWLREALEDATLALSGWSRLSGGAIQFNIRLDIESTAAATPAAVVLRCDAPSTVNASLSRADEFGILQAVFDAGVQVPQPFALCSDPAVLGAPFFIMQWLEGTTSPATLTRKARWTDAQRRQLVHRLGAQLARIHSLPKDDPRLKSVARRGMARQLGGHACDSPTGGLSVGQARVAEYRACLDSLPQPRPALEWALAWLHDHAPGRNTLTLCHGDYRTGNLLIDAHRLNGVLDWEFACISDPLEDLGWFTAPCWRFGAAERRAGGLGDVRDFLHGYNEASGSTLADSTVLEPDLYYWQVLASARWAIIALQQGERFTSGAERTLELGLTGRMIAELEAELLRLIKACPCNGSPPADRAGDAVDPSLSYPQALGDEPDMADLLAVAVDTLRRQIMPSLGSDQRYPAAMIARVMTMAERELLAHRKTTSEESARRACLTARQELATAIRGMSPEGRAEPRLWQWLHDDAQRRLALSR